jgi:hypothetical protein
VKDLKRSYMITVRIINNTPLEDVREAIATTLGLEQLKGTPEDVMFYYKELLLQKHSVLRSIHIRVKDTTARQDVTRQLLRATKGHPQPYVQSGRPDWTGKPRDESTSIFFLHDHTPESFMEEASQRLCFRAMQETRLTVLEILKVMAQSKDPLLMALAWCCIPNCLVQYGCPEGRFNCGWFGSKNYPTDLRSRRDKYYKEVICG